MNGSTIVSVNPLFLRHDLMIELGRLELELDEARARHDDTPLDQLESRCAKISEALNRLPA